MNDTDCPLVILGNAGLETDASGKAIEVKSPLIDEVLGHYMKLSGTGRADFRLGLLYAASFLVALSDHNYEVSGKLQNEATRLRGID